MDVKKVAQQLHPLERKLLPALGKEKEFSKIVKRSGLDVVEATRALQWLQNKNVVSVEKADQKSIAFKLIFQSAERTLTEIEVNSKFEEMITAVTRKFNASLRGR